MTTTSTRSLAEVHGLTADDVAEARAWCEDTVADPEVVEDATDDEVLRHVARHYEGGLPAFRAALAPEVIA
jgi:hypothetical protein